MGRSYVASEVDSLSHALKELSESTSIKLGDSRPEIVSLYKAARARFPDRIISLGTSGFTVAACGRWGFAVTLERVSDQFMLHIGPGMMSISSTDEAMRLLEVACRSDACLEVVRRGKIIQSWRLLEASGEGDRELATGGYGLGLQFWRRVTRQRYRNSLN